MVDQLRTFPGNEDTTIPSNRAAISVPSLASALHPRSQVTGPTQRRRPPGSARETGLETPMKRALTTTKQPPHGPTFRAAAQCVLDDYRMNRRRSLVDVQRHV